MHSVSLVRDSGPPDSQPSLSIVYSSSVLSDTKP